MAAKKSKKPKQNSKAPIVEVQYVQRKDGKIQFRFEVGGRKVNVIAEQADLPGNCGPGIYY